MAEYEYGTQQQSRSIAFESVTISEKGFLLFVFTNNNQSTWLHPYQLGFSNMIFRILMASLLLSFLSDVRADVITFEELTTFTGANPAGGGSFYNGNSGSNTSNSLGWTSQGLFFNNTYNSSFGGFWNGWSYSNVINTPSAGFTCRALSRRSHKNILRWIGQD